MSKKWFPIQNGLIDRYDLNIYEKMCCIVMARYADKAEFDHLLTLEAIAKKMGCGKEEAERAIIGLIQKGLLDLEDAGSDQILHQASADEARPIVFDNLGKRVSGDSMQTLEQSDDELSNPAEGSTVKKAVQKTKRPGKADFDSLTASLYEIIEEKINDREARIILNFGNHDLEHIHSCYRAVKESGAPDVMEALLEALQSTVPLRDVGEPAETAETSTSNDASEASKAMNELRSTRIAVEPRVGGQINLVNINKMKLYKQMADKAKKK